MATSPPPSRSRATRSMPVSCRPFRLGYSDHSHALSNRRARALSISMNALTSDSNTRPFSDSLLDLDAKTPRTSWNEYGGSCSYSGKNSGDSRFCGSFRFIRSSPFISFARHNTARRASGQSAKMAKASDLSKCGNAARRATLIPYLSLFSLPPKSSTIAPFHHFRGGRFDDGFAAEGRAGD